MFHIMWKGLNLLEKEINEYQEKVIESYPFVPQEWLPEDFSVDNMKEILKKSIDTGREFEEYMPDKYKKHLKIYLEKLDKGIIY